MQFLGPFCLVVIFVSRVHGALDEDVVIDTLYGKIKGSTTLATNGKTIYSFKAIPFARKPERFEPPVALSPETDGWGLDVVRDGTQNPPSCAQFLTNLAPASEDCLYLNVHMPIKPGTPNVKLPVMVYIYGGANLFGDTVIYGPNRLMGHDDVILVVLQYRLGALGFLSTGDDVVPGNNGYKDQRQALRWIQENIEHFGGDKSQVTLFGESAGAAAAFAQLLSPTTAGLIHKVIAQSGTPLAAWARDKNPRASAERFAISVGCTEWTNSREMVDCMKALSWQKLAIASIINMLTDISQMKVRFDTLGLVIEPEHDGAFLTEEPLDILKQGTYPREVPILLGANQHEGSMILGGAWALNLNPAGNLENPVYVRHELIPTLLNALELGDESLGGPASQSLADYYIHPSASKDNFTQITDGLVDMLSVFFFKAPILLTADYLSQFSSQVHLYSFEHQGPNTLWSLAFEFLFNLLGLDPPPVKHGVMHADDLIYLWTLPFVVTGKDRQFSEMVCKMWTDFAITADPTPGDEWPKWRNYTTKEPYYYKLDLEPELLYGYTKNWRLGYQ